MKEKKIIYQPLVSIIMNCYNGEKYLRSSINSILNQKYNNWELIFLDNCSSDKSISIAKEYKNRKIKIIKSKKHLKLYHARNIALKYCRGKYISFLDTDDTWHPLKLFIQVNYLLKNNKEFVFSNFYYLHGTKKIINKKMNKFSSGYMTQKLLNDYGLGILTVLASKKLFDKRKFNNNYEIIGDFDCFIKISTNHFFGYISRPLAQYRIHSHNLSEKKIGLWVNEIKDWLSKNEKQFIKKRYSLLNLKFFLFKLKIKSVLKKYFI